MLVRPNYQISLVKGNKDYLPKRFVWFVKNHLHGERNGRKIGKMLNIVVQDANHKKSK